MNTKLVESLAQIIESLTPEEFFFLEQKIKTISSTQERPFYEIATPSERAKAFLEWSLSHSHNSPILSDEAISRESIYGERG
jgi:hypothetical protein